MTKVDITVAGHIVIVEADEPLNDVAATALALFRVTDDPQMTRGYQATGFQAERASSTEYIADQEAYVLGPTARRH